MSYVTNIFILDLFVIQKAKIQINWQLIPKFGDQYIFIMVLNYIWIAFFLIAFVVAIGKLVIGGDTAVFTEIINASFASAKTGFEISLGLTGILSLWLGIMKIGEKGGVIQAFARLAAPVFSKLFPVIPREHPVTGSIFMNLSANLLGLDNAPRQWD